MGKKKGYYYIKKCLLREWKGIDIRFGKLLGKIRYYLKISIYPIFYLYLLYFNSNSNNNNNSFLWIKNRVYFMQSIYKI